MNSTILLIEDNEETRAHVASILELAHYYGLTWHHAKGSS